MPINFKKIVSPTPASSDPYADAVRQRAIADALQKQAVTPRNFGTANQGQAITMGLTQLAEALLARRAGRQATGTENTALQGTRTANEAIANSLGAQGQIGGIDQAPESQATQDFRNQYGIAAPEDTGPVALQSKYVSPTTGGAINTGAKPLVDALAGQDPRVANQSLTQMQLTKLSPPAPMTEYQTADLAYKGEALKAELDQKKSDLESHMQDRNLSLQQQADLAKQHNEVLLQIAKIGADAKTSSADDKKTAAMNKDQEVAAGLNSDMDRLATAAATLRDHPGLGGITGIRGALPNIPGTDAANAAALLENLKSQVTVDVLSNMRQASKTGGALGNVSNYEDKMLASNISALGQAQSKEAFQKALNDIIAFSTDAKKRHNDALAAKYSNISSDTPAGGGSEKQASGWTVKKL
jgi:hypothetical protein